MPKPSLWRWYGLTGLWIGAFFAAGVLDVGANRIELLRVWGAKGIGPLCLGLCLLLRGLDYLVLCAKYPPYLGQNAPKWDFSSRRWSPVLLAIVGGWFTLVGIALAYIGGRYLCYS
jgi:hypothetical protein